MEVNTIESNAFEELEAKINLIAKLLIEQQLQINKNKNETCVDSYDVCSLSKINETLLQRLRLNGLETF